MFQGFRKITTPDAVRRTVLSANGGVVEAPRGLEAGSIVNHAIVN
jgi:hypothetical protein